MAFLKCPIAFVVIAHINNNSVGMFQDFIHRLCVEVNTAISYIKGRIIQTWSATILLRTVIFNLKMTSVIFYGSESIALIKSKSSHAAFKGFQL